ncbi:branched-chain amino acid ABC transporter permease [Paenarthrobacter sp. NPDC089316]|uniref:branched-chain amino acid ABC transporter permease n=1 Tax=unclassified Paenarthrobacter TaxID=2634190 RepID=UPI003439738F
MDRILEQLVNGLTIGSTYALVALGVVLIFSILDVMSLAQGELFLASGYIGLVWTLGLTGNIWLAILAVIVSSVLLGALVERVVVRPTLKGGHMATLISTVGVGIILTNLIVVLFGPYNQPVPNAAVVGAWHLGPVSLRPIDLIALAVLAAGFFGLTFIVQKTRLGVAIRATAENPQVAATFGIRVNRMRSLTFVIGTALAGLAAVILALKFGVLTPVLGLDFTLKALIVTIIGGTGRIAGAVIAAFGLGIVEAITTQFLGADWVSLVGYTVLLLFIMLLPEGIFRSRVRRAG